MSRAKVIIDGTWIPLAMTQERILCCDCKLAHDYDFKIVTRNGRRFLYARLTRNRRATAAGRRPLKFRSGEE